MSEQQAHLRVNNEEIALTVKKPTLGKDVVEVSPLVKHNLFTYDPGFVSTAACESKITFINGEKGELLHYGYPIEQLAEHSNYMSVCYLLLNGELPTSEQLKKFETQIQAHQELPEPVLETLQGFAPAAHPMAKLLALTSSLSGFYQGQGNMSTHEDQLKVAYHLIAKMPTMAAACYRHSLGKTAIAPNAELDYASNFFKMMFDKMPSATIQRALDRIFILHADHEQNASTSTVRLIGSTGAGPFESICGGIAALWGPAHGGANEATLKMLKQIGDIADIEKYIEKAKDKNDPFRLMGFGHRVYKNYDPRAAVMRQSCHEVLQESNSQDNPLFKIALKLEAIALQDDYFIQRKLFPNVDFYSGITLSAMDIPTEMFTVMFALGRTVGWIAHWIEMQNSSEKRIGRPRQLYTGPTRRNLV